MAAGKVELVITNPPMERWTTFFFPWGGGVTDLYGLNMPALESLYMDESQIDLLPYNDMRNIRTIGGYFAGFTELDLYRLPNLEYAWFGENYNLTSVDAHGLANLSNVDFYYCSSLSWLDVSNCPVLKTIYLYSCDLAEAMVDQILADLVANGANDGYITMTGGNNAPPSPAGQADVDILVSRGWRVYVNTP